MQRRSIDARMSTQQMEGLVKVACAAIRELARRNPGEPIRSGSKLDNSVEDAFAFIDECRARFDAYDEADAARDYGTDGKRSHAGVLSVKQFKLPEDWQSDCSGPTERRILDPQWERDATDGSWGH